MTLILSGPHPLTFASIGMHFSQAELAILHQWIIELRRQVLFDKESKNASNLLNIRFQHVSWLIYMLIISPWHLLFCQRNLLMNAVCLALKISPSHRSELPCWNHLLSRAGETCHSACARYQAHELDDFRFGRWKLFPNLFVLTSRIL